MKTIGELRGVPVIQVVSSHKFKSSDFFSPEAEPLCEAATDITHHVGEANQGEDHHADGVTTCEACGGWSPARHILHEFGGEILG